MYALAGVACLGLALGILGSRLLETKEDRDWHEDFANEYEALTLFDHFDSDNYHYDSDDDCGYFDPVSDADDDNDDDDDNENVDTSQEDESITDIISQPFLAEENPSSNSSTLKSRKDDKAVTFHSTVKEGSDDSGDFETDNSNNKSSTGGSSQSNRRQSAKLIDRRKSYGVNFTRFFVLLGITLFFAYLIGYSSGWSFWNTMYYAVVTAATIGYGDLCPHTQQERFLAIIFIPLACAVTGHCLAYFAHWVIERQGVKYRKTTFDSHTELTLEDLRVMDLTGDGKVAWFEFLEFMLVAMKKVDPELLDELRDYFDRLDVANTGTLERLFGGDD